MEEQSRSHTRWLALRLLTLGRNISLNLPSLAQLVPLLRLEPFLEMCRFNPRFAVKALGRNYLARNLDARARIVCFIHHYHRMNSLFSGSVLRTILHWDVPLYQKTEAGHIFSLTLGSSRPYDKEGELSLLLKLDSLIVFTLTFTLIPGWITATQAHETILISRLQGERANLHEIRLATKAMGGVRPRALLFAALQGIASTLGVEEITAVKAIHQTSYCGFSKSSFLSSYDRFFTELHFTTNDKGFASCHLPVAEKPLALVAPSNRRTTRKRQAFKRNIQLACAESFARVLDYPLGCFDRRVTTCAPQTIECLPFQNLGSHSTLISRI